MVLKSLFFFARECSEFQFFFFFSLKCFLIPDWLLGVLNILFFFGLIAIVCHFFCKHKGSNSSNCCLCIHVIHGLYNIWKINGAGVGGGAPAVSRKP